MIANLRTLAGTWVIANRLHRARRTTYAGRMALALAALTVVGVAIGMALTRELGCPPDCDHP